MRLTRRAALAAALTTLTLAAPAAAQAQADLPIGLVATPDPVTELRYQAGPLTDPADVPAWVRELPVYWALSGRGSLGRTTFYASNAAVTRDATFGDCVYEYACLFEHPGFTGRMVQVGEPGRNYDLSDYGFDRIASSVRNRVLDLPACGIGEPFTAWDLAPRSMAAAMGSYDDWTTDVMILERCN